MNHEKNILNILWENPYRTFKAKELARKLNITQREYRSFRNQLRTLVQKGKVFKYKKNRYGVGRRVTEVEGILHVKTQGYGFLIREKEGEDIFTSPMNMGTALHGDTVRVQLFAQTTGKSLEGKVVGVVKRARKNIVGIFQKGRRINYVVPDELKILRDIYVAEEDSLGARHGQKVVVQIVEWEDEHLNPEGKVVEVLGYPDDPGVDVLSIAKAFDLPTEFSPQTLREAENISDTLSETDYQNRLDLRGELCFTIDPAEARDFDDAVSLTILENENYCLGVHIADVSYFVKWNGAMDLEARKRGTSVYLVDRVIPMLPEKLSNDTCCLKPEEDKLAYSVLMEVTPEGEVVNYKIGETVIRSRCRFTYEEVQKIIEKGKAKDAISEAILNMHHLSQSLIEKRRERGGLDFATPEVRIQLDDTGTPVNIEKEVRLDSHRLIEEFMILANTTIARHVEHYWDEHHNKKPPFIYRIHEKPEREKLEDFAQFAQALGLEFRPTKKVSPKMFQRLLDKIRGTDKEVIVEEVMLRSMMKAKYATKNVGHFGLAFTHYTHFTSPIRRYPDLMVHRLLKVYENGDGLKEMGKVTGELPKICQLATDRETVAQEAERESVKIKQVQFIEKHVDEEFDGVISGVVPFGIFVKITRYLIEGLVHITDLEDDYYIHDEKRYCLIGQHRGKVYQLGDPIKVKVARVNREERVVDFVLAN